MLMHLLCLSLPGRTCQLRSQQIRSRCLQRCRSQRPCQPLQVSQLRLWIALPRRGLASRQALTHLGAILAVARHLRRPCAYVGYSAFLALALLKRVRVFCWEGANRVDIVAVFAPWALTFCAASSVADCIACMYEVCPFTGEASCHHISEEVPLRRCNHYVAAMPTGLIFECSDHGTIEEFYIGLGVAVQ